MKPMNRSARRVSTTLVREATDWGLAVSEKRVRSTWLNAALLLLGALTFFTGLMFALPVLVGLVLSAEMTMFGVQVAVVAGLIVLAIVFSVQSRKGPRNALELDQSASQLRIGHINRHGAFVRGRVIALRQVVDATVAEDADGKPELNIVLDADQIRVALTDAKVERLTDISGQIRDAAAEARTQPRSRIESSIAGIGASYREISKRVVSRFH